MSSVGFALLGHGFMGAAHSRALHSLRVMTPATRPRLESVCGRDAIAVRAFAERYGWQATLTDWHEQVADERAAVFDNTAPILIDL